MMAQIALYPDPLLSQVLMAATYPDEFAQAVAWAKAHPDAKGDAAVKMVENQPWDPSVASLVAFPDALITLGDRPDYVRNLGDAFLAQPQDVMDSVQRLRRSAQKAGNLQSNEQVNVSVQAAPAPAQTSSSVVVTSAAPPPQVIVIQPALLWSTGPGCIRPIPPITIRLRPVTGGHARLRPALHGVWASV
jgi:hypothetical protein